MKVAAHGVSKWDGNTRRPGGVPGSRHDAAVDAARTGKLGGKVYSRARLRTLESYLRRRGVKLKVGVRKGNYFRVGDDGKLTIGLQRNPTEYMVWHELIHYNQYRKLGLAAYRKLDRPRAPEQFVYDQIRGSERRWGLLNLKEQQHAYGYLLLCRGDPYRYLHRRGQR